MALWAAWLACPLTYLQAYRWHVQGHDVPVYYFVVAGVVAAGAFLTWASRPRVTRWDVAWWCLPLTCLPGILLSDDPAWSLREWTAFLVRGLVPGACLALLVDGPARLRAVLAVVVPVAVAAALLGLYEMAADHNPLADPLRSAAGPSNPLVRWSDSTSARPVGTQGNRIPYAACLVAFVPVCLQAARRSPPAAVAAGVLAATVAWSQVRSAWAGLAVAMAAWVALLPGEERGRAARALGLGLAGLAVLTLALPMARERLASRLSATSLADPSLRHRAATAEVLASPGAVSLVGVGYGAYASLHERAGPGADPDLRIPDNQWVRWLLENGLVGAAALLAFLAALFAAVVRGTRDGLDRALLAGWLGLAFTFVFFDGFYAGGANMTFWCLLGLCAGSLRGRT